MAKKSQFKGQVTYQKIIKAEDPTLVLFKLALINSNDTEIPPDLPTNSLQGNPLIEKPLTNKENDTDILTSEEFTALIARKPLTFLLEVGIGDIIIIYGHFNYKKQFITEKYLIQFKENNTTIPAHLIYPQQKK